MQLKPMKWEQRNSLLSISHVMGLVYSIEETGLQVRCIVDGCTLYKGRSVDAAKEKAQKDAERRIAELME